jgi:hypothetical protein
MKVWITRETTVSEIIEADAGALEVFEKHGVSVEYECPEAILDFPIEDCEDMCHIDNVDALIADLNAFFKSVKVT